MSTKRCGIYLITHIATGRCYVGQSIDIDRRWREHAKGASGSGILHRAIAKYGWSAFDVKVLELCAQDDLNVVEQKWVAEIGSMHPAGFNLTTGGAQFKVTDEVRRLISERTRDFMTPEWIAARAAKIRGVPKSAEHRAKIGAAHKASEANTARLIAMARNQSAESREKISIAHRGKKASAETRAKLSASKKGQRLGVKRPPFSDETKARMSASAKARCARQKAEREART